MVTCRVFLFIGFRTSTRVLFYDLFEVIRIFNDLVYFVVKLFDLFENSVIDILNEKVQYLHHKLLLLSLAKAVVAQMDTLQHFVAWESCCYWN